MRRAPALCAVGGTGTGGRATFAGAAVGAPVDLPRRLAIGSGFLGSGFLGSAPLSSTGLISGGSEISSTGRGRGSGLTTAACGAGSVTIRAEHRRRMASGLQEQRIGEDG